DNEKEWLTCNDCSEKKKGKRSKSDTMQEFLNQFKYYVDDTVNMEEICDDEDNVLYELVELEEL
ncbi:5514_t:CDS:1, partial [Ambispora leptoticha]